MFHSPLKPSYHGRIRTEVLPLVPETDGTLLDLGGGMGSTAAWLKTHGRARRAGVIDLVAPDAVPAGLDFHVTADLEDRELLGAVITEHGPFNTILCLDVLEHLSDPWQVVAALHRSLVPGGTIIASIPNVRNYTALLPLLLRNQWRLTDAGVLDRTHLRFFVRETAVELMTSSGLLLEAVHANPSGGRAVKLFRMASLGLLNSFTDLQYLIRVRRPALPNRGSPCSLVGESV